VFRVGKNTFKEEDLIRRIAIRPLNETPGLEVYGNEERVQARNLKSPWQEVSILVHRFSEIDTPAFAEFLNRAIDSFHANLKLLQTRPEDLMPWKLNGERWHLGEKGFPAGAAIKWDRALLPRLLQLIREIEPGLEIGWSNRVAITLHVPGVKRAWAT